eukprot:jgi/Bigna1/36992/e_gw1.17.191.1
MMNVGVALVLYVALSTGLPLANHYRIHHSLNPITVALTFFCGLNIIVCAWEIGLGLHIRHIQGEYKKLKEKYGKTPLGAVKEFFFTPVTSKNCFSLKFWSLVWTTYALYDPSYQNNESFGFFVDVGNGWSTLLPSFIWIFAMTYHGYIPAYMVGCMGIAKYWQELYGTVIYTLSYVLNGRYKGRTSAEVFLFVAMTNGLWFVFPLLVVHTYLDRI